MKRRWQLQEETVLSNRYKIIDVLGQGGFSITYKAVHIDINKVVAIKEFYFDTYMHRDVRISNDFALLDNKDSAVLEHYLKNFLEEARVLASFSDMEGVVHVTDFFYENKTAYIVMDYIDGRSLESELAAGKRMSWDELVRKFLPLIEALSKIHHAGVIHRDIKPDNIIVTKTGLFTLIDFGSALHITDSKTHSIYLTDGYAPKEQYLRSGKLGAYTDIYALCAVMYRCVTGRVPEQSIQRAVFDELKRPSELGIQIPLDFEQVIMKGMEVEAEERWGSMSELHQKLSSLLPKERKPNRILYVFIGIAIVMITGSLFYVAAHYNEFRLQYLMTQKKTVTFRLDAPAEMTTYDFEQATKEIKKRADAFAGGDYLMETDAASIMLTIPEEYFKTGGEEIDKKTVLYYCFAFGGKWRLHNSDASEFLDLDPSNIDNVDLEYGTIPIVSTSGEPAFYDGETHDWSAEEGYYIRITFDGEAAYFLKDYLIDAGYLFVVMAHSEADEGIHPRTWISGGDGKTAYYYIGTRDEKRIAETMFQVLSGEVFSIGLNLAWPDENVTWINPTTNDDSYQRSVDNLGTAAVELKCEVNTDWDESENQEKIQKGIALCERQLSTLEIPYALGMKDNTIHIRIPYDKVNQVVLFSLFDPDISIGSIWDAQIFYSFKDTEIILLPQNLVKIIFKEDSFEDIDWEQEELSLYLRNVKIGELESINAAERSVIFKLLFEEDEKATISAGKMSKYIYNIFENPDQVEGSWYNVENDWQDESGVPLRLKDIPAVPTGLDNSRFSLVASNVEQLGGTAQHCVDDYGDEQLLISFENWAGDFPTGALGIIEDLYVGEISKGLCKEVQIEFHSWYKGKPVSLSTYFNAEGNSRSVICSSGQVASYDQAVLDEARKYVEKSNILTPSEDRFVTNDSISYNTAASWVYILDN